MPSWVQIGPFEASKVSRKGDIVTAEIAIAADAPVGVLLDAHIEFGKAEFGLCAGPEEERRLPGGALNGRG